MKNTINFFFTICNKTLSDFNENANHFNKHFSSKCTPTNSSCLPISVELRNPSVCFSTFNLTDDEVLKIIRALDINKTHGHDETSGRMIEICDDAIIELYLIIITLKTALRIELFQKYGKNQLLFLFIKKEINRLSRIIGLFHCYPFLIKYFKVFYLTQYLILFKEEIYLVNISLGFDQMMRVSITFDCT